MSTRPGPLTDVELSRLRQRYAHMRGRCVALGLRTLGIVVEAASPEEMLAKTDQALVEMTKTQPPS